MHCCFADTRSDDVFLTFASVSSDGFFNSKMQTEGKDSEEENVSLIN